MILNTNNLIILIIALGIPVAFFLYYFVVKSAINNAIDEHQNPKRNFIFSRWIFVVITLICLGVYAYTSKPFWRDAEEEVWQAPDGVNIAAILGLVYLFFEVPYQLVKTASRDVAENLLAAGDDRRNVARLKAAETLAMIMGRKLKVSCELQAFSNNEEFVFVTYIVGDKPIATRLKLNQADKPESWKKLGEWIMGNYQSQNT